MDCVPAWPFVCFLNHADVFAGVEVETVRAVLLLLQIYSMPAWGEPNWLITSVYISLHGMFEFLV